MKEYGCCPKFGRGNNSTYTFTKTGGGGGACTLQVQLLLSCSLDLNETLHSCNTLPADVCEGIWFLSKICDLYPLVKKLGNVIILMYTDETVLVLNNPTLLKTLW